MIDWYDISYTLQILVPLIAVSIAIFAFWNYLRIRNWKLLALSVAYSLLAAYNVMPLINGNLLNYATLLALSFLAFALLAYVYYSERKARGIKITKLRWIVGGLVAISFIATMLYFTFTGNDLYLSYPAAYSQLMVQCLMNSATILLVIYSIISLYSYYHIVRNKNTLIVMAGFIFLLSTYLVSFLFIIPTFKNQLAFDFDYIANLHILITSLTFAGYALFIIALLRLRGSR